MSEMNHPKRGRATRQRGREPGSDIISSLQPQPREPFLRPISLRRLHKPPPRLPTPRNPRAPPSRLSWLWRFLSIRGLPLVSCSPSFLCTLEEWRPAAHAASQRQVAMAISLSSRKPECGIRVFRRSRNCVFVCPSQSGAGQQAIYKLAAEMMLLGWSMLSLLLLGGILNPEYLLP